MFYVINKKEGVIECLNGGNERTPDNLTAQYVSKQWIIIDSHERSQFMIPLDELENMAEIMGVDTDFGFENHDEAAEAILEAVKGYDGFEEFPLKDYMAEYNPKKARAKVKAAKKPMKDPSEEPKEITTAKPAKVAPTGKRITAKSLAGNVLNITFKEAKPTSVMGLIQKIIEEFEDKAIFEEVRSAFMSAKDCDEKYANGYIAGSIREGYVTADEDNGQYEAYDEEDEGW